MTNEIRKIIRDRLNTIQQTYGITEIGYRQVQDDSLFPHIVVDFTGMTPTDMGRQDFLLDIHIWAKDNAVAFDIMDAVRKLFRFWNAPEALVDQTTWPTFYEMSGGQIDDPDKTITHLVLRAQGQVYERSETDSSIIWR